MSVDGPMGIVTVSPGGRSGPETMTPPSTATPVIISDSGRDHHRRAVNGGGSPGDSDTGFVKQEHLAGPQLRSVPRSNPPARSAPPALPPRQCSRSGATTRSGAPVETAARRGDQPRRPARWCHPTRRRDRRLLRRSHRRPQRPRRHCPRMAPAASRAVDARPGRATTPARSAASTAVTAKRGRTPMGSLAGQTSWNRRRRCRRWHRGLPAKPVRRNSTSTGTHPSPDRAPQGRVPRSVLALPALPEGPSDDSGVGATEDGTIGTVDIGDRLGRDPPMLSRSVVPHPADIEHRRRNDESNRRTCGSSRWQPSRLRSSTRRAAADFTTIVDQLLSPRPVPEALAHHRPAD